MLRAVLAPFALMTWVFATSETIAPSETKYYDAGAATSTEIPQGVSSAAAVGAAIDKMTRQHKGAVFYGGVF